jgi:2-oxoglutarate ferredoxin oxidoreductase subunit beta
LLSIAFMGKTYTRPEALKDVPTHYCAGCGHGIVHRVIAEAVDELGIRTRTIGVAPVGCAVLGYDYFNFDVTEAAHGRTPAVATGIKRALSDRIVFTYQGDGDLAAIGTAEIVHAANRGENICVFFVNNTVYGMTGGQMAPTTMLDQMTATTQTGRRASVHGNPVKVCELLSSLDGSAYLERVALKSPASVRKLKKAVLKAFRTQIEERGFSLVECLSPCPTYQRLSPLEAIGFVADVMTKTFPPGVYKDWEADGA